MCNLNNKLFLCSIEDVKDGEKKRIHINELNKNILLVNLNGSFYAVEDKCTHAGATLSNGVLKGNEIECPWHGAKFNIKTGEATVLPAVKAVRTFNLLIENNTIYLINPMNKDNKQTANSTTNEEGCDCKKDGCHKHHELDKCEQNACNNDCCCGSEEKCFADCECCEGDQCCDESCCDEGCCEGCEDCEGCDCCEECDSGCECDGNCDDCCDKDNCCEECACGCTGEVAEGSDDENTIKANKK